MNKRTDAIRSMFKMPDPGVLSADNAAMALPRVSAGSVRSLKDTFSDVEQENERLRQQIGSGQMAIPLDPHLIGPSPLNDRFPDRDKHALEELKASMAERGQLIAILVRPHPNRLGRYQSAFGHRRVRAARELGIQINAYVREMSDEELVIAQGVENSARENPSFIERACFAMRLENAGYQRSVVQTALSVDRAEASKLVSVAKAISPDVITEIGRAPKIGRSRWQAMADALQSPSRVAFVRALAETEDFQQSDSDARFTKAYAAAIGGRAGTSGEGVPIKAANGVEIGRLTKTAKQIKITMERAEHDAFVAHLVTRIPDLYEAFASKNDRDDRTGRKSHDAT